MGQQLQLVGSAVIGRQLINNIINHVYNNEAPIKVENNEGGASGCVGSGGSGDSGGRGGSGSSGGSGGSGGSSGSGGVLDDRPGWKGSNARVEVESPDDEEDEMEVGREEQCDVFVEKANSSVIKPSSNNSNNNKNNNSNSNKNNNSNSNKNNNNDDDDDGDTETETESEETAEELPRKWKSNLLRRMRDQGCNLKVETSDW